jgi:hypothetical protein
MTAEQHVVPVSVVRGTPTAEELAALVAVLMSRRASLAPSAVLASSASVSAWADPAARMRRFAEHGPGAWRRSGLPG